MRKILVIQKKRKEKKKKRMWKKKCEQAKTESKWVVELLGNKGS